MVIWEGVELLVTGTLNIRRHDRKEQVEDQVLGSRRRRISGDR